MARPKELDLKTVWLFSSCSPSELRTIRSSLEEITVPAGPQAGAVFRLKGKGVRNVQGYGQGDLMARVQIEIPPRLNAAQRAKLEEFAKLCDDNVHPMSKSFLEKAKSLFS